MQQIKIFKGVENEFNVLEQEINTWLIESGARVLQIFGNIAPQSMPGEPTAGTGLSKSGFAPSDIMIVVLYEKA